MSTPAEHRSPGRAGDEVAQRRDRMRSTIEQLQRVAGLDESDGRWREAAASALAQATTTWERHVAGTEAPQGILADVLEREPRLAHLVTTLRREHGEIRELLTRTGAGLPAQEPGLVREQLRTVTDRLSRHHELGAELIYNAYEVDLGGSG